VSTDSWTYSVSATGVTDRSTASDSGTSSTHAETSSGSAGPSSGIATADIATAVALVSRGLGIRLVPEPLAKAEAHRVARIDVGDGSLTWTLVLAWNTRSYQSRALRAFTSLATKTFTAPVQPAREWRSQGRDAT
jgi:DNA-binding transcriptional LysR family regulator